MAYIARADGTREDLPGVPDLESAKKIVGGWVERVYPRLARDLMFLCDEEGLLKGKPINLHGTELYGDPIVGDIVVMTRNEGKAWR